MIKTFIPPEGFYVSIVLLQYIPHIKPKYPCKLSYFSEAYPKPCMPMFDKDLSKPLNTTILKGAP